MGKQLIFAIFSSLISIANFASDSSLVLKPYKTIVGEYKNFSVDNLGNVYLVTNNNQIKKLNQNLDSVAVFNDTRKFGNITHIDVTNPLKILVYYGEFSTVVVLDRFLNVRNKIDFRQQQIFKATAICLSFDNNIWLFDEIENKLKKIADDGTVMMESNDFRLVLDSLFIPETIIDNNGQLFLYHHTKGFLISDYYGAIKKVNPITNLKFVQLQGNKIMGIQNSKMMTFNFNLLFENEKKLIGLNTEVKKLIVREKSWYLLLKDKINVQIVE